MEEGVLKARLSRIELGRTLRRCEPDVLIELSINGERYPAVTCATYRAEDGKIRVCILAYGQD